MNMKKEGIVPVAIEAYDSTFSQQRLLVITSALRQYVFSVD
jgi:hypothetical protein